MNRRALLLGLAVAATTAIGSPSFEGSTSSSGLSVRSASAAVSVLVSLDELVAASTYVVVATAGDRRSVWEDLPSGRRIVTYTKLSVEQTLAGAPGGEVWVRTLGGVVGKLGQAVSGEAQIASGSRALLFLVKVDGAVVVTAMAQGHYPVTTDDKGRSKLAPSPDAGALLSRSGPAISARERLVGATLDDGLAAVKQTLKARNGDKK